MIDKVCNVAGSGNVAHPEAWKRLYGCQSFTDEKSCLKRMKWHLENSTQHYMDPTDVDLLFETLVPELEYVTRSTYTVDGAPGTPPLAGATPPSNAPPLHVLAKRQRTSSGGDGSDSGGGASSGGIANSGGTISVHVDRAELTDMLTLRRSTLLTMLDCVERAAASAKHAVAMSIAARNGFETEERRLSDCAIQLAKICER
jgi:hypothetical protein